MKQNITSDQLKEPSEKGQKKLRKWSLKKGYAVLSSYDYIGVPIEEEDDIGQDKNGLINKKYKPPLLSVGQMIEFLGNDWVDICGISLDFNIKVPPDNENLCDTLWQAVKEILEK